MPFLAVVTYLASRALPIRPRHVGLLAGFGGGVIADASWHLVCPRLGADALCSIGWENVQRSDLQFRDHFRINQARQILEEKFRHPPNIQDLARSINMDASTLCKQFKTLYKCSIFEFAQKYRMEHASELLKSSDLGIKQIAYELNYSHTSNFTAAFKKYFGITPRAYRESHLMSSRP